MKSLPNPKDKLGYTDEELRNICQQLSISVNKFDEAFGVNTCAIGKDGKSRYYRCDVERTLWKLGSKLGKFHEWD